MPNLVSPIVADVGCTPGTTISNKITFRAKKKSTIPISLGPATYIAGIESDKRAMVLSEVHQSSTFEKYGLKNGTI